jgi:hypothetical protein
MVSAKPLWSRGGPVYGLSPHDHGGAPVDGLSQAPVIQEAHRLMVLPSCSVSESPPVDGLSYVCLMKGRAPVDGVDQGFMI